jgi:hypothetical protein
MQFDSIVIQRSFWQPEALARDLQESIQALPSLTLRVTTFNSAQHQKHTLGALEHMLVFDTHQSIGSHSAD